MIATVFTGELEGGENKRQQTFQNTLRDIYGSNLSNEESLVLLSKLNSNLNMKEVAFKDSKRRLKSIPEESILPLREAAVSK